MTPDSVTLVDQVREKLAAVPSAIALEVRKGERPSDAAIARAEKRIGVSLPMGLAALYRSGTALYWTVEDAAALGYEEDDAPIGQLELLPIDALEVQGGLVRFSNDGHGNGFCLDLRKPSKRSSIAIVWWDHDSRRQASEARSFDAFFAAWAKIGFINERTAGGDVEPVARFLRTGKLAKAKPAASGVKPSGGVKLPSSLRALPGHSGVCAVAVLPEGRRAVSGGYDGVVRIFDIDSCKIEREARVSGMTFALAVSADGRRVVSVGDGGAQFLDVETGRVGKAFGAAALAVAFVGDEVVLGHDDGTLALYRPDGTRSWKEKAHPGPVVHIEIDAKGRIVSLGHSVSEARLCAHDAKKGAELMRLEGGFLRPGADFALAKDRRHVLVPLASGKVATIDLDAPKAPPGSATTSGKPFYRVALLDEGALLVAFEGVEAQVWDLAASSVKRTVKIAQGGIPSALVPRGDGKRVLLGSYAGWLCEWAAG